MTSPHLTLYGYWRSGTSYRVRIALNLKGVSYDQVCLDLRRDAHKAADYVARQPQGLVPALQVEGDTLIQSPAILEWLEERYPAPPLLPDDLVDRARVRAMAAMIGCDTHPLNNLRVLKYLKGPLTQPQTAIDGWISHWIAESFTALETMIAAQGGDCAFGDNPTLADCYLVPQVYAARRFNVPLGGYPNLVRVADHAMALDAVQRAHPDNQPDAD